MRFLWMLCGLALLAGCSETETETAQPTPPELFTPDEATQGPRLWLDVTPNEGNLNVTLWGSELGKVFGWSAHVGYDEASLALGSAQVHEAVLGADAPNLASARVGDVALGATLRSPDDEQVTIDTPTELALVALDITAKAASRLDLERVAVRRVDGSYVAVATMGGALDTNAGVTQ